MKNKIIMISIGFCFFICSCTTVDIVDRSYLNDPDMELANDHAKNYQYYIHSIREGSTASDLGKSSGGCGCN